MTRIISEEMANQLSDLYQRTGALVLNRCRYILKDDAEAEDAMQEVFLRIIKYKDNINEDEITLAWLFRTAERCCFNRLKKGRRTKLLNASQVAEMVEIGSSDDASGQRESKQLVLKYFRQLNPKLAQLAIMHYVDELPQEEIGKQLGWSRRTVGKKLNNLREKAAKMAQNDEK